MRVNKKPGIPLLRMIFMGMIFLPVNTHYYERLKFSYGLPLQNLTDFLVLQNMIWPNWRINVHSHFPF